MQHASSWNEPWIFKRALEHAVHFTYRTCTRRYVTRAQTHHMHRNTHIHNHNTFMTSYVSGLVALSCAQCVFAWPQHDRAKMQPVSDWDSRNIENSKRGVQKVSFKILSTCNTFHEHTGRHISFFVSRRNVSHRSLHEINDRNKALALSLIAEYTTFGNPKKYTEHKYT